MIHFDRGIVSAQWHSMALLHIRFLFAHFVISLKPVMPRAIMRASISRWPLWVRVIRTVTPVLKVDLCSPTQQMAQVFYGITILGFRFGYQTSGDATPEYARYYDAGLFLGPRRSLRCLKYWRWLDRQAN